MRLDHLPFRSAESSGSLASVPVAKAPTRLLKWVATLVWLAAIVGGFGAVGVWNHHRASGGYPFSTLAVSWDHLIPRVPAWAWVYVLWYPSLLLPFVFKAFRDDLNVFLRVSAGYLLQLVVCLPLFLMPIRVWHTPLEGVDVSTRLLSLIYTVDHGFNVFPSMHVSYVTYLACVGVRLGGRKFALPLWSFCALIMASTLFTKQHYLVDLPAGFALGLATHVLVFREFQFPFQKRTGPVSQ